MAYIECMYKDKNICKQTNEDISKVELEHKWKCLYDCIWCNPIWTADECKQILLRLLREMKNCTRKSCEDLDYMRCVHGHCSEHSHDFDSISYNAIIIKLVQLKYWKNISNHDFCEAIILMQMLGLKIPKSSELLPLNC